MALFCRLQGSSPPAVSHSALIEQMEGYLSPDPYRPRPPREALRKSHLFETSRKYLSEHGSENRRSWKPVLEAGKSS